MFSLSSAIARFRIGQEKEYFIENLAVLLASGMNILSCLNSLKAEIHSTSMRRVIDNIKDDIEGGAALWRALEKVSFFPAHIITLIRIGEETGRLPQNLTVIAKQQEKERIFRSKLYSAMMYPLFVLGLTVVIGIGIAWFILPRLSSVFSDLELKLPLITRIVIALGNALKTYGIIIVPCSLVLLAGSIYFVFFYKKTKHIGEKIFFSMPIIKKLIQEIELSRMGYLLGNLLDAGLPIVTAIQSLASAKTFSVYHNLYTHLALNIDEGNSFKKSFNQLPKINRLVPIPIQEMMITGEQSGNLSEILLKIGTVFENKTENTTKNLSVILEPLLLVIIWIGVVFVALAVILPIYSLIGGLNQGTESSQEQTPENTEPLDTETIPTHLEESGEVSATSEQTAIQVSLPELPLVPPSSPKPAELEILQTGTGYLNVRNAPLLTGDIIHRVTPGEIYPYLEESNGWYKIEFEQGKEGWVFSKYVKTLIE